MNAIIMQRHAEEEEGMHANIKLQYWNEWEERVLSERDAA
jgi:hypothetical protein